ncbi:GspH/FimT family pseudopilin [uncultured Xylophilus sp.]|uniref:GspH/FimT family pseudopilin n=1 Tax=uncultured Xylophilus sp. TaxID=296832 RepID=UPI0025D42BC4|nr:GspH/FimT family pseudopilin [uncultured Xylophilus sp.]
MSRRREVRLGVHGFTLLELMITIGIVGVLMVLAAPSFVTFKRNSELTSAANALLAGFNTARSEAMKRNVYAGIVPNDGSDWASGWKIFVDANLNGGLDSGETVVFTRAGLPSYFTVTGTGNAQGTAPYALFNGSGYATSKSGALGPLTITIARNDLTGTALLPETRRLMLAISGRTRICTPASANDAKCAASGS